MQTENSKLATAAQWAGVLLLVSLAVAINGGANFYGGFILATELGMPHSAGYAVGSALAIVTLFLLGAYLTGQRGLPVIYLHVFSALLLMFDVVHLAGMSVNAVSAANGSIAQLDAEIADIDYQIGTAEKELAGLAVTVTGNNVQSLTAQINTLKNTAVSGGALWDVSAGCTAGGYRTKCRHIEILQGNLDAEIAAVSGAEVTKKREEITKLRGMKTAKQGMKQGMSQKSDSAGFIAKMKPKDWSDNGFLLAISAPFAVSFELFSVLAFGMLKNKLTPQNTEKQGMEGNGLGYEIREWIGEWVKTRSEAVTRVELARAEAEGKEAAALNAEIAKKAKEVDMKKAELSDDIETYLMHLSATDVGKLMDKKGCKSTAEGGARLRDVVWRCLEEYTPEGRIVQSGENAMHKKVDDKFKHFLERVIPALITIGLAEKNDGVVTWVGKREAWEAIGRPNPVHIAVSSKPVINRVKKSAQKPELSIIKGGKS